MKIILLAIMLVAGNLLGAEPSPTPTPIGHFTGKHEKVFGPNGNYLIWSEYQLPDGTRVWIISEIGKRI